jgi:hypothetical protein
MGCSECTQGTGELVVITDYKYNGRKKLELHQMGKEEENLICI